LRSLSLRRLLGILVFHRIGECVVHLQEVAVRFCLKGWVCLLHSLGILLGGVNELFLLFVEVLVLHLRVVERLGPLVLGLRCLDATIKVILNSDIVELSIVVLPGLVRLIAGFFASFNLWLATNLLYERVEMILGTASSSQVFHAVDCQRW